MTYLEHHLYGGEIFYLYYYGIHVFFQVGDFPDDAEWISLVELKTRKNFDEDGCMLHLKPHTYQFLPKPNESCLVNETGHNTYCTSGLRVYPTKMEGRVMIPIEVNYDGKLRKKAIELGLYKDYEILDGTFYLEKFCGNTNEEILDLANSIIYYKDENCHLS